MASSIISVVELFEDRSGQIFEATSGNRNYVRKFRVMVNDNRVGPLTVSKAPGIPLPFSPYMTETEFDLLALLTGIQAAPEHADDWQSWIVTCTYSTEMPTNGPGDFNSPDNQSGDQNNPEHEPPDIDWDWDTEHRALSKDLDGKPIVNSAGQPFTPVPTFEVAPNILNFARNELFFDRSKSSKYSFVTNKDVFLGAPPGTVLCYPPKAKRVFKGKSAYWRVTYKFKFGRQLDDKGTLETIQPVLLDQGLCRLEGNKNLPPQIIKIAGAGVDAAAQGALGVIDPDGKVRRRLMEPIPILKRGIPITQPVLLDGKGQEAVGTWKKKTIPVPAGPGGAFVNIDVDLFYVPTPTYLTFRVYRGEKLNTIVNRIP